MKATIHFEVLTMIEFILDMTLWELTVMGAKLGYAFMVGSVVAFLCGLPVLIVGVILKAALDQ